jgi:hypothetical protein
MLVTNKFCFRVLGWLFNGTALPTNYYIALFTSATVPTVDTNIVSDLTQIATGNGYTSGGISLNKNATDFPNLTEDDTNDRGQIELKDIVWTASGGSLPSSGGGARYAAITDDNATVGSREVYIVFDLASSFTISSGSSLTLADFLIRTTSV